MYGLDNNSGISVMPDIAPTTSPVPLWFTEGGANQSPSYPGQDWHNMMQGELLNVVKESGLVPNKADHKQVAAAIRAMIANSANVVPVGVPLPWPTSVAPSGWLKCNGATFDKAKYPLLAAAYPSGILPDLRGEWIRGWDDGRGVDAGRTLLSAQASTRIENVLDTTLIPYPSTVFGIQDAENFTSGAANSVGGISFSGNSVRTSYRVRVRNLAFNYIVRAA